MTSIFNITPLYDFEIRYQEKDSSFFIRDVFWVYLRKKDWFFCHSFSRFVRPQRPPFDRQKNQRINEGFSCCLVVFFGYWRASWDHRN